MRGSRREFGSPLGEDFHAASFDIYDLRTPCVKALMAQYGHGFHRIPHGQHGSKRPTLKDSPVAAARWYEQRFAESHLSSASALEGASKIDLCFIDAEHSFGHVRADVRFFQPRCRFLMFHDIVRRRCVRRAGSLALVEQRVDAGTRPARKGACAFLEFDRMGS